MANAEKARGYALYFSFICDFIAALAQAITRTLHPPLVGGNINHNPRNNTHNLYCKD
jgi:hypothetical protein